MMNNYVVTGFDESYWQKWGISWLASLIYLAKHDVDQTIIFGYDLSSGTQKKITDAGVRLLPGKSSGNIRSDTLRAICKLASKEQGVYAYWDADVYFQEGISEIFKLANDDIVISSNQNHGFLAAPDYQWFYMNDLFNLISFVEDKASLHDCLFGSFSKIPVRVDNTWNFVDLPRLKNKDDVLTYKDKVQKVIHPSGHLKLLLTNRNILFWELHKELYNKFFDKKKSTPHKLVMHNQTIEAVENNI